MVRYDCIMMATEEEWYSNLSLINVYRSNISKLVSSVYACFVSIRFIYLIAIISFIVQEPESCSSK